MPPVQPLVLKGWTAIDRQKRAGERRTIGSVQPVQPSCRSEGTPPKFGGDPRRARGRFGSAEGLDRVETGSDMMLSPSAAIGTAGKTTNI
jgi:hypothetical protein